MTEFDHMRYARLPNWGRWGRQDDCKPDSMRLSSSLAGKLIRGDDDEPPTAPPPPIDSRDAEELDRDIMKLPAEHRAVIIGWFYKRDSAGAPRPEVAAAVRALIDIGRRR